MIKKYYFFSLNLKKLLKMSKKLSRTPMILKKASEKIFSVADNFVSSFRFLTKFQKFQKTKEKFNEFQTISNTYN